MRIRLTVAGLVTSLVLLAGLVAPAAAQPQRRPVLPSRGPAPATSAGPRTAATVYVNACYPSASTWAVNARWPDGYVGEFRMCIERDSSTNKSRTRLQARVRKGGTADANADWDLDSSLDNKGLYTFLFREDTNTYIGTTSGYSDVLNTSYIVKYQNWVCINSSGQIPHSGHAYDYRMVHNGDYSEYKTENTYSITSDELTC